MSEFIDIKPPKVVPLFGGGSSPELGTPNEDLIAELRKLLEHAESGFLQGMAAACTRSDGRITTVIQANDDTFAMSHAISALWFRYQAWMAEDAQPEF